MILGVTVHSVGKGTSVCSAAWRVPSYCLVGSASIAAKTGQPGACCHETASCTCIDDANLDARTRDTDGVHRTRPRGQPCRGWQRLNS